MKILKLKYITILNILFFVVVFILTRQVPFSNISVISNICLVLIFLLSLVINFSNVSKDRLFVILFVTTWVVVLLFYSVAFENNSISNAIRFSLVILLILFSYFVITTEKYLYIFIYLIIIQCLFLVFMELYIHIFYSFQSYLPLRSFFIEKGWGDIYSYDGIFYRIQLKGNALITFCFFITFIRGVELKYKIFIRLILVIGIILSGNFAYLISSFIFLLLWYLFNTRNKKIIYKRLSLILVLSAFSFSYIFNYIQSELDRKQENSLGTRYDQAIVLNENLHKNIITTSLGRGLGNTVDVSTTHRDYTGNTYYELQVLYFLNQLGYINFFIFILMNLIFSVLCIKYFDLLFIYFCYIIYAVTNPYILDTNHIIVIILLKAIYDKRKTKRE